MLLLSNSDVKQVLTMGMAMQALEEAYVQLARGEAVCRPRIDVEIPTWDPSHTYVWGTMEGGSSVSGYFAIRMKSDVFIKGDDSRSRHDEKYSVRPGLYCGLILLVNVQTGEPVAMLPDGHIQHVRVGASAGISAKHMAKEDSRVVGILGSGGMARTHAEAFCQARGIDRVQVYSPTRARREAYAGEMAEKLGIEVLPLDDPRKVHQGADILAGCTDSTEPVIIGRWLEEGTHMTNVLPHERDEEAIRRIDVTLRLGDAPTPVGMPEWSVKAPLIRGADLTYAAKPPGGATPSQAGREGRLRRPRSAVPESRVISLGELLEGRVTGRSSSREITEMASGRVQGIQFFPLAAKAYELAQERGLGRELPTEWFVQDIPD